MATHPRPKNIKPKGWRKIVVNDVEYWWKPGYVRRVSDRKQLDVRTAFINMHNSNMKWDYNAGCHQWTPKIVSEIIKSIEIKDEYKNKVEKYLNCKSFHDEIDDGDNSLYYPD